MNKQNKINENIKIIDNEINNLIRTELNAVQKTNINRTTLLKYLTTIMDNGQK